MRVLDRPVSPLAAALVIGTVLSALAVLAMSSLGASVLGLPTWLFQALIGAWLALALFVDVRTWPRYGTGRRVFTLAVWAVVVSALASAFLG